MSVVVEELGTIQRDFGLEPSDLRIVGDTFQHRFVVEDSVDCEAADFTGYTPTFEIVGSAGSALETGTVVPSPGDATGTFTASLTALQTSNLGAGNFAYRLRIVGGGFTVTLFCGAFVLSECVAA